MHKFTLQKSILWKTARESVSGS